MKRTSIGLTRDLLLVCFLLGISSHVYRTLALAYWVTGTIETHE